MCVCAQPTGHQTKLPRRLQLVLRCCSVASELPPRPSFRGHPDTSVHDLTQWLEDHTDHVQPATKSCAWICRDPSERVRSRGRLLLAEVVHVGFAIVGPVAELASAWQHYVRNYSRVRHVSFDGVWRGAVAMSTSPTLPPKATNLKFQMRRTTHKQNRAWLCNSGLKEQRKVP